MVINHAKKFIFIHVPRTGGYSAYEMMGIKDRGGLHYSRRRFRRTRYFSFGFMRNPWDRMYSCYRKQKKVLVKHQHRTFKQYLFEGIDDGNLIDKQAMWFLEGCDYIGFYETLQQDWDIINRIIGLPVKTLPHLNGVGSPDYRPHYDNELIDYIAARHTDDIRIGGYTFE